MNIIFRIFVFFPCAFGLLGCAHLAEKQTGQITSDPDGASVFFYSPVYSSNMMPIGTTPVDAQLQQGLSEVYIVAQKSGYETARIRAPRSGSLTHHFVLNRSYAIRISEEVGMLSKEFKRDAARAAGVFDRALNSPRMLSSSIVSEARSQLQEIALNYPEHANSATMDALKQLSADAVFLTSLSRIDYDTAVERIAAQIVAERIAAIRTGLGINV